jgi:hypothetical protein
VKPKIYALTLLIMLCCTRVIAQSNLPPITDDTKNNKAERSALAQISALYEVKDFMRYASKNMPRLMVAGEPDLTRKYYWIKLGISNFDMFRTTEDFFVYPKTKKIYLCDQMDNSRDIAFHLISLQQWRYWRRDPRFLHSHTFKNNKLVALDSNGKEIHGKSKSSKPK